MAISIKIIADQALEYRFYIKDKYESKDASGKETYVLFKQDDEINWNYVPDKYKGDAEFVYQLHRHQWMIYQANAYTVTHDEKYVKIMDRGLWRLAENVSLP